MKNLIERLRSWWKSRTPLDQQPIPEEDPLVKSSLATPIAVSSLLLMLSLFWALYDIFKKKRQGCIEHKIIAIFFIIIFFSGIAISFSEEHALAGRLVGILLIIYGIENWSVSLKSVFSFLSLFGIYLTFSYLVIKIFL